MGEMERLEGIPCTWGNFDKSDRTFQNWAESPTARPLPLLRPETVLNCYEMILYAAVRGSVQTHADVHAIYSFRKTADGRPPAEWFDRLPDLLAPHGRQRFRLADRNGPRPRRGDLVFWNGSIHISIATGRTYRDGSPEVLTFWPPPGEHCPNRNGDWSRLDAVKKSSIRELLDYVPTVPTDEGFGRAVVVEFGPGPWWP